MIYDIIGVHVVTKKPNEMIATYMINRLWFKALTATPPVAEKNIFIGEVEDIMDKSRILVAQKAWCGPQKC